jgi:transposase
LELPNDIRELQQLVSNLIERITTLENEVKELKDDNTALRIENSELKKENVLLKTENAELKARLNQNSNNSSKPPSSDYFNRKPAFTKTTVGKKGGQSGV